MDVNRQILEYEQEQTRTINLVASENRMSCHALACLSSDINHRYLIPPPHRRPSCIWDYPNQRVPRRIERHAIRLARQVFNGKYADVRPLSGTNAALAILMALVPPGGTVFTVPSDAGGHFATDAICKLGRFRRVDIPYNNRTCSVDLRRFAKVIRANAPKIIFLDASMILFPYPIAEMRAIAPPSTIISYDASHTMGLIGGGQFQQPFDEGANLIHGSTHKSLFGPQKGLIVCRDGPASALATAIHNTISPLFVSNAHLHHIAALAVALEEMKAFGREYAFHIVQNSHALACGMVARGVDVFRANGEFTRTHQLWTIVGTRRQAMSAMETLDRIGIRCNAIKVPFTGKFGLRLGLSEITRRGFRSDEMGELASLIADGLGKVKSLRNLRARTVSMSAIHPTVGFCRNRISEKTTTKQGQ